MRRRLALLALLVLALALGGCSQRERANPFDPANPNTGGRPVGFVALAGDGVVTLRWQAASAAGLEGFRLLRRAGDESEFRPITPVLRPTVSSFVDTDVLNGVPQQYQLYHVFFDDRGGLPAEDVATPGPLKVWVADIGGRSVVRITPDGRHVAFSEGSFVGPTHVAVNPSNGLIWVSDAFGGDVVLLQPGTGGRFVIGGTQVPGAIALDPARHEGWVCDPQDAIVHHVDESGARIAPQLAVQDPLAAAVDLTVGSVWVCDNRGDRVLHYTRAGTLLANWATRRPSRVAVDSLTRDAWVTSFEQGLAFRLDPLGVALDTVAIGSPVGVRVDHRHGRIWIADPGSGQLTAIGRDGNLLSVTRNLPGVTEVDVDLATGEAWVTSPSEGEVTRVSPSGSILRRLRGLVEPYGISLTGGP